MRQAIWLMSAALLVLAAVFGGACLRSDGLDGEGDPSAQAAAADNSFCYVCHVNYKKEKLARRHALKGIGCAKCHGDSDKHSSDENNVTPPDVMFARPAINPLCMKCHDEGEVGRVWRHKPVLAKIISSEKVCTDCHGAHRLTVRTRRWDKQTGKLIADDGVRMTGE